jgi:hypothetical protein
MKHIKYWLIQFCIGSFCFAQSQTAEHPILFTKSFDGISWSIDPIRLIENGISPSAVFQDGKIYLYYISDKLSLITSNDYGITFKQEQVSLRRISNGILKDPNVVFFNGVFRMFFIISEKDINILRSAVSDDGHSFIEETNVLFQDKGIFKPDVIFINNLWIIFLTLGGDLIKLTSNDGKTFLKDKNFLFPSAIYSGTIKENNFLRTYYTGDYSINSFKNENGKITKEKELFRDHNIFISEPSIIKTADSSYYMFYKKILPNDFIDTCGCEKKLKIDWEY